MRGISASRLRPLREVARTSACDALAFVHVNGSDSSGVNVNRANKRKAGRLPMTAGVRHARDIDGSTWAVIHLHMANVYVAIVVRIGDPARHRFTADFGRFPHSKIGRTGAIRIPSPAQTEM